MGQRLQPLPFFYGGFPLELNFVHLIFTLRLEKNVQDGTALLGMRQDFEQALSHSANCSADPDGPCARQGQCPYHQGFSQKLTADPAALKRFQKPSLPFVFQIPLLPPLPNRGCRVEVGLVLVGPAVNFAAEYVAAVKLMLQDPLFLRKVPASLVNLESGGYAGNRSVLGNGEEHMASDLLVTLSLKGLQESAVLSPDAVTMTIATPMRLMSQARPLKTFSFSPFIRALFRRVSAMAYYYGESEEELDYKWLAEQSRTIEYADADCRWVELGMKWSGLTGTVILRGNLQEYHPFLLAGEYLQVGKGATFGLGRYLLNKMG